MKISVLTLGCKVNQAESSHIAGALENSGHQIVDVTDNPEICIINTCTVTSKSDYQSRQLIRRACRVGARVIVTGCYSELNKEAVLSMDGVEAVIDNHAKIEGIISKFGGKQSGHFYRQTRSRFFIKVQDGCNFSCSYCAIPKARGVSRSIALDEVIQQVRNAELSGYNEIVLTGIHLGTYGLDLIPKVTLSDLLRTILNKSKIKRIRLSSLEVHEISDELLELLTDRRVCNHLHIPLQSGDDRILRLMNRTYDSRQFSTIIQRISKKVNGIAIGTDVIVGFPSEYEPEFQNTYILLESLPITYMHIFPYSQRPGTAALEMPDNVTFETKKKRLHLLEQLNSRKKTIYMQQQIGKTLDVIVEKSLDDGTCIGTTGNYLKIMVTTNRHKRGSIIYTTVEGIRKGILCGTPIF